MVVSVRDLLTVLDKSKDLYICKEFSNDAIWASWNIGRQNKVFINDIIDMEVTGVKWDDDSSYLVNIKVSFERWEEIREKHKKYFEQEGK